MEPGARPAKRSSGAPEAPAELGGSPKRGRWAPPTLPTEPALYDGPFPFYRRPAEEGRFSLDAQRCYHPDARQLRYFAPPRAERPEPAFDLRHGYRDLYVRRDEGRREGLEHLLQWVAGNRDRLRAQGDAAGAPRERRFRDLAGAPYQGTDDALRTRYLRVSLFRGTLYVSEVETPAARQQREQRSDMLQELAYMGYKFERYMCADTPDGEPGPHGGGEHQRGILHGGAHAAGLPLTALRRGGGLRRPRGAWPEPPACYVELKTCKELHSPAQRRSFYRYKLIKWWAQSFLPGGLPHCGRLPCPRWLCGHPGDLRDHEDLPVDPGGDRGCWKPAVCMNFCEAFLAFLKKVVTEDDPQLVHLFAWEPGRPVSYTRHQGTEHVFLPAWYVETMSGGKSPD
ncbi:unnamed protein product [Lepidochelys kempii]